MAATAKALRRKQAQRVGRDGPEGPGIKLFMKRLRLAWALRVWPWRIPANVLKWVAVPRPFTEGEIRRGQELAAKYGWEKSPSSGVALPAAEEERG